MTTLNSIELRTELQPLSPQERSLEIIDRVNDQIEAFMLADELVIEQFLPCDFELLDKAIEWICKSGRLGGNRFCELGSGFGVGAMLAATRGMEAAGIEIEPRLVEQSIALAEEFEIDVRFVCGDFAPDDLESKPLPSSNAYQTLGWTVNEIDVFFCYPWPGERTEFLESWFAEYASNEALLLTYRGREGMWLQSKR